MKKLTYLIALIAILAVNRLNAQVTAMVTIANETVSGSDYLFDVYLHTTAGTSGDLYLGNADFVLNFQPGAFSNPTLSASSGFCTLVPTIPGSGGLNTLVLQINYANNTATSINGGDLLVINLNGPTPGGQSAFNTSVAKIDGSLNTHRLGRFKISGYQSGAVGLGIKYAGNGLKTGVFTIADDAIGPPPFASSAVTLQTATLPVEWLSFHAFAENNQSVRLDWQAEGLVDGGYFELEKQRGNEGFEKIAEVRPANTDLTQFTYLDQSSMSAVNYYRIRQVDPDGRFSMSPVVEVTMEVGEWVKLYPNPVEQQLTLESLASGAQDIQLRMYDVSGRLVFQSHEKMAAAQKVQQNLSQLPAGIYSYQLVGDNRMKSGNLIKK